MKKVFALLGLALIGWLAWIAAAPGDEAEAPVRRDVPRAIGLAADRFDDQYAGAVGAALDGEPRDGARVVGVAAGERDHANVAAG